MRHFDVVYPVLAVNLRAPEVRLLLDEAAVRIFLRGRSGVQGDARRHLINPYHPFFESRHCDANGREIWTWRLVDDWGRIVYRDVYGEGAQRWVYVRRGGELKHKFRAGPVPGTGKLRRYGYARWLRNPRTKAAYAETDQISCGGFGSEEGSWDEDEWLDGLVRRSVRHRPLRNAYDDISRHRERNWKRSRATQWKG